MPDVPDRTKVVNQVIQAIERKQLHRVFRTGSVEIERFAEDGAQRDHKVLGMRRVGGNLLYA